MPKSTVAVLGLVLHALIFASSIRMKTLRPRRIWRMKSAPDDNEGLRDKEPSVFPFEWLRKLFQRLNDGSKEDLILAELKETRAELKEQRVESSAHFASLNEKLKLIKIDSGYTVETAVRSGISSRYGADYAKRGLIKSAQDILCRIPLLPSDRELGCTEVGVVGLRASKLFRSELVSSGVCSKCIFAP